MIFDQAQEDVLADQHDCLLVEAPPGSGKTHTAIRLVGRDVTVVLNDQKIIDHKHIDGLTAIATYAELAAGESRAFASGWRC